jgi:hypothetical protein
MDNQYTLPEFHETSWRGSRSGIFQQKKKYEGYGIGADYQLPTELSVDMSDMSLTEQQAIRDQQKRLSELHEKAQRGRLQKRDEYLGLIDTLYGKQPDPPEGFIDPRTGALPELERVGKYLPTGDTERAIAQAQAQAEQRAKTGLTPEEETSRTRAIDKRIESGFRKAGQTLARMGMLPMDSIEKGRTQDIMSAEAGNIAQIAAQEESDLQQDISASRDKAFEQLINLGQLKDATQQQTEGINIARTQFNNEIELMLNNMINQQDADYNKILAYRQSMEAGVSEGQMLAGISHSQSMAESRMAYNNAINNVVSGFAGAYMNYAMTKNLIGQMGGSASPTNQLPTAPTGGYQSAIQGTILSR